MVRVDSRIQNADLDACACVFRAAQRVPCVGNPVHHDGLIEQRMSHPNTMHTHNAGNRRQTRCVSIRNVDQQRVRDRIDRSEYLCALSFNLPRSRCVFRAQLRSTGAHSALTQ